MSPHAMVTVVGLLLWLWGGTEVQARHATGWGLVAAIPPQVWLGIAVTGAALAHWVWRRAVRARITSFLLAALIVEIYGLPPLAEGLPRTTTVWLHLGFIDQFADLGVPAAGVDSRFSWPGFFAWWGMVSRAAGGADLAGVANWAPLFIALVTAASTVVLARAFGVGHRVAWYAAALVSATNWIEQDYFSPQATAYLLALTVLVLAVSGRQWPTPIRAASLVIAVVAMVAVVMSHQLTPVMLGLQLAVLIVVGKRRVPTLLVVVIAAELTWFVLGARDFWSGDQLRLMTGGLGNVGASFGSNLASRMDASDPGLVAIRLVRVGLFVFLVGLAGVGVVFRWRERRPVAELLSLAVVPAAASVQGYGGEMFMRCALFALAPLGILAAEAVSRLTPGPSLGTGTHGWAVVLRWRGIAAVALPAVMTVLLACVVVVVRGGNDSFSYVTANERRLAKAAVAATPRRGLLLLAEEQGPVRIDRVGEVRWQSAVTACRPAAAGERPPGLAACASLRNADTVLVTRSMIQWGRVAAGRPADWAARELELLKATGKFRQLAVNADGEVLVREPAAGTTTSGP